MEKNRMRKARAKAISRNALRKKRYAAEAGTKFNYRNKKKKAQ